MQDVDEDHPMRNILQYWIALREGRISHNARDDKYSDAQRTSRQPAPSNIDKCTLL